MSRHEIQDETQEQRAYQSRASHWYAPSESAHHYEHSSNPAHQPTTFGSPTHEHGAHESLKTKTCEEMETGGFRSVGETMATSKRCTQPATEVFNNCGK